MLTSKEFYQGFQADYFAYRQMRLKNELDSLPNNPVSFSQPIFDYSVDDHLRSVKIDIRQTYFQAIETVFELIFSLKPNNGVIYDEQILSNLTKRKNHYEEIRKFANDEGGLEFLDDELDFGIQTKVTALRYLFYGFLEKELNGRLPESLLAIRKILKIIAIEISDRKEYNSYKHGLRIFPSGNTFAIYDHKTKEKVIDWDIKDSMTFIDEDDKTGKVEMITKLFDPVRDINLSIMCNNLISNIIMIRRTSYEQKPKTVGIVLFNSNDVERLSRHNVKIQDLKLSSTPIKR